LGRGAAQGKSLYADVDRLLGFASPLIRAGQRDQRLGLAAGILQLMARPPRLMEHIQRFRRAVQQCQNEADLVERVRLAPGICDRTIVGQSGLVLCQRLLVKFRRLTPAQRLRFGKRGLRRDSMLVRFDGRPQGRDAKRVSPWCRIGVAVHLDAVNSALLTNNIERLETGDVVSLHHRDSLAGGVGNGQGDSNAAMLGRYREKLTGGQRELIRVDLFGAERFIGHSGRFQPARNFGRRVPRSRPQVEARHGRGGERNKMPRGDAGHGPSPITNGDGSPPV
jgi:hypothetical protein